MKISGILLSFLVMLLVLPSLGLAFAVPSVTIETGQETYNYGDHLLMIIKKKPVALYYSVMSYQEGSLARLRHNFDLITLPNPDHDTAEILRKVEVLFAPLGYKTNRSKIDKCSHLCVIASNTTGHPHIDVEHASKNSIRARS